MSQASHANICNGNTCLRHRQLSRQCRNCREKVEHVKPFLWDIREAIGKIKTSKSSAVEIITSFFFKSALSFIENSRFSCLLSLDLAYFITIALSLASPSYASSFECYCGTFAPRGKGYLILLRSVVEGGRGVKGYRYVTLIKISHLPLMDGVNTE